MYHGSVCVWGALCIEPVLEVEGEREEKKTLSKNGFTEGYRNKVKGEKGEK